MIAFHLRDLRALPDRMMMKKILINIISYYNVFNRCCGIEIDFYNALKIDIAIKSNTIHTKNCIQKIPQNKLKQRASERAGMVNFYNLLPFYQ